MDGVLAGAARPRRSTSSCWRPSSPGYGASGRNGGWLSAELSGSKERYARTHGRAGVEALVSSMEAAVDEVIDICRDEGIDADIVKHGVLYVARSPAQLVRMREGLADDARGASARATSASWTRPRRLRASRSRARSARCSRRTRARVQPAKLVAGIADAVERRGVRILERTRVTRIDPGRAMTERGACARAGRCCAASRATPRASAASAGRGCR